MSCISVLFGSKLHGMNAIKPFVFLCKLRIFIKCLALCSIDSTVPYIIVAEDFIPKRWASSIILNHVSLDIFKGLMISFTSSSRISAPAPGREAKPDFFNLCKTSLVLDLLTFEIMSISDADNP